MTRPDIPLLLTENAREVLRHRYLRKNPAGEVVESPEELFWRVATAVASADRDPPRRAEEFYGAMARLEFLPNSPALMNAGRELGQYFACFVLPVADALTTPEDDGIFDTLRSAATIHKSGGGTGFSFSRLRPEGAPVTSTHGVTSGPLSFLRVFNAATEAIHQGGFRRGANMGILRIDHPDILDFIDLKRTPGEMTNFNLSVGVTDEFLAALPGHKPHEVADPVTGRRFLLRDKMRDASGRLVGTGEKVWTAAELWDRIARRAWETGEPGAIFLDRINAANPTPQLGPMEATNPCGEMPLLPFEACNLGSINLALLAREDGLDWERFRGLIRLGVRFLDDVIDVNRYPKPQIERLVKGNRKIGLGLMGWADLLFRLGLPYDGEEALALARRVASFLKEEAWKASMDLAEERGGFPHYSGSLFTTASPDHPYFAEAWRRERRPVRNATLVTLAPTGTISILAGATGGIEPAFSLAYRRRILDGRLLDEVHPYFAEVARREGFGSEKVMREIVERGSCQGVGAVPERWRRVFRCAFDIPPEGHLGMQAAFQAFTDNAVSKTVNFAEGASPEDVRRVFDLAVRLGVKGVTVYRNRSRAAQPMETERDVKCLEC